MCLEAETATAFTKVICFTQLLFQKLEYWGICKADVFYGFACPGLPTGTYTAGFNGGRKADIKYGPDGLSPILVIKVLRTVHKSRHCSIMLSVWIVIVILCLQILM